MPISPITWYNNRETRGNACELLNPEFRFKFQTVLDKNGELCLYVSKNVCEYFSRILLCRTPFERSEVTMRSTNIREVEYSFSIYKLGRSETKQHFEPKNLQMVLVS